MGKRIMINACLLVACIGAASYTGRICSCCPREIFRDCSASRSILQVLAALLSLAAIGCHGTSLRSMMSGPVGRAYHAGEFDPNGDCSKYTWGKCPPGMGLPSNSSTWHECCGPNVDRYCPMMANECAFNGACCSSGFGIYCNLGGKTWCCTEDFPVCGLKGGCYKGSCECTGCIGPDPCQFQECNGCDKCCGNYIPAICTGYKCSGGSTGVPGLFNNQTSDVCSS